MLKQTELKFLPKRVFVLLNWIKFPHFILLGSSVLLIWLIYGQTALADEQQIPAEINGKASEKRLALVIGNSQYRYAHPLKNPVNDANDMADTLSKLGFQVIVKVDADLTTMNDAIYQFGETLKGGGIALFYYSGHGMQIRGENYLIPVDADIRREDQARIKAINANEVLHSLEKAHNLLNLVILDACRNDPFPRSFRSAQLGLAEMKIPYAGTLLVYATSPGNIASDGEGRNGTFTKHLISNIQTPAMDVQLMLRKVRTAVKEESLGQQIPWDAGAIEGEFYFVPKTELAAGSPNGTAPVQPEALLDPEQEAWNLIKESNNVNEILEFINNFPTGKFLQAAKLKLTQLENQRLESEKLANRNAIESLVKPTNTGVPAGFIFIPAGKFMMGSELSKSESPVHALTISKPFFIADHEVTLGEYRLYQAQAQQQACPTEDCPVLNLNRKQIKNYLKWINKQAGGDYFRLPSEAEWEYAARAGSTTRWNCGDQESCLQDVAFYQGDPNNNQNKGPQPVKLKQPNPWGLYDMHGNVWEWVEDWYVESYSTKWFGEIFDPTGPKNGKYHVARGGSWKSTAELTRVSYRYNFTPNSQNDELGFRLVWQK